MSSTLIRPSSNSNPRFRDLLLQPAVKERFDKVRRYFFLRESTYDITRRCNMGCDGCYYFRGDKQHAVDNDRIEDWTSLFRKEKERGITFVVLAGAEPSLRPEILQACHDVIPLGCIATNGLIRIPTEIRYKIHVSTWGGDETSERVRKVNNLLARQIDNYAGDPRAIFVYTYCRENIEEAEEVVRRLARADLRVTFNLFSAPVGYDGPLRHTPESLAQTRRSMLDLMERYPWNVVYSPYNAAAHTNERGLHDLFTCPYPRVNPSMEIGLGRSFRQYRSDLNWDRSASCCVPDTDCPDCRHYAAGSAVVTARLYRHAGSAEHFNAWLDYVDTYLAVWVLGYERGADLNPDLIDPPGRAAGS